MTKISQPPKITLCSKRESVSEYNASTTVLHSQHEVLSSYLNKLLAHKTHKSHNQFKYVLHLLDALDVRSYFSISNDLLANILMSEVSVWSSVSEEKVFQVFKTDVFSESSVTRPPALFCIVYTKMEQQQELTSKDVPGYQT